MRSLSDLSRRRLPIPGLPFCRRRNFHVQTILLQGSFDRSRSRSDTQRPVPSPECSRMNTTAKASADRWQGSKASTASAAGGPLPGRHTDGNPAVGIHQRLQHLAGVQGQWKDPKSTLGTLIRLLHWQHHAPALTEQDVGRMFWLACDPRSTRRVLVGAFPSALNAPPHGRGRAPLQAPINTQEESLF
jgi:hypothetical protein